MTALNKQALRERYSEKTAPKCQICGAVMTIQRAGAGSVVYGCTGRIDKDGEGYKFAEGRDFADNHYALSRVTVANNYNPDVLELLDELEAAEKHNAELQRENVYIRNRYKELDLLIGKNILVMQAAIIEWQATGDAKNGLAWIYNTLFGPGELPDEAEKDAQAYFDRKYAPIDEELMALHKWFWEQSEAERAAAGIGVKGE
ncbi:ead/Ea22-like family protein [Escherichia coli]|uniref:ead/Ea22-like family protein n=1 Tax=Escherichia coli TaxID=562 RepID=UPI00124DE613|nr:ead/Ea22-like family protein [Escherichia coli O153]KAB2567728.1 ead/Ea22-like family protein [Escherichia coli]HBB1701152.1 ead/Ea22-like family protein [Escherichia coli]HCN7600066.1 ead/Ea22-like family protein [Escherichia coli]HDD9773683.1 ead/Ea22-like family protein [Escherichia coli]